MEQEITSLLNKDFEEQEKKNREKYGSRDNDHIASIYKKSVYEGNVWAWQNVVKYMTRFTSNSSKANNSLDVLKSIDYLSRLYEANKSAGVFDIEEEVIDKLDVKKKTSLLTTPSKLVIVLEDQPEAFQKGYSDWPEELHEFDDAEFYKLYKQGFECAEYNANKTLKKKPSLEYIKSHLKDVSKEEQEKRFDKPKFSHAFNEDGK